MLGQGSWNEDIAAADQVQDKDRETVSQFTRVEWRENEPGLDTQGVYCSSIHNELLSFPSGCKRLV